MRPFLLNSFHESALIVCSIAAISVIAYLPAVDNFFISDDFTLLAVIKALDQNPMYIFDATSEFFRVVSYVYFWVCFKTFGLMPELYYWAGIGLHAVVSLLVYLLVKRLTGDSLAGWAAAVFFAAYERHQEAVMWISAANSTILTLNCLVFLILWERVLARRTTARVITALLMFVVALFSKESAVILVPVVMVGMLLRGHTFRDTFRKSLPLLLMLAAFAALWLSQADRNFFVYDGHYAVGLHAIPVSARAVTRLLSQTLPFLIAMFAITRGFRLSWNVPVLFFAALLVFAVVPTSFLTYADQISSRHTYLPSVGLAGLNGIFFAALYRQRTSARFRAACMSFLLVVVAGNVSYIWLKKEPQFRERSAPTRELISVLNGLDFDSRPIPVHVCGFPLHSWIGETTVVNFTKFDRADVIFSATCSGVRQGTELRWDEDHGRYIERF